MTIRLVEDVGAPLAVTAVDLIIETTRPDWTKWATYVMAAYGYISAGTGFLAVGKGGDFSKNVGIAALPAAARNIYEQVRGVGSPVSSRRLSLRKVSRWPAPLEEQPFGGARLV